jgi:hypothetical protein
MKKSVIVLVVLLLLPFASALDRFVTLSVSSVRTVDGMEIELEPTGTFNALGWRYCVEGIPSPDNCRYLTENLKSNWVMTSNPISTWGSGETHTVYILINGDGATNGRDLRMKYPGGQCRKWQAAWLSNCPLAPASTDWTGAGTTGFFAGTQGSDEACTLTNSGYGDVDDCTPACPGTSTGCLNWTFSFTT